MKEKATLSVEEDLQARKGAIAKDAWRRGFETCSL